MQNYMILFFERGTLCTIYINAENRDEAKDTFRVIVPDCDICHIQNTDEQAWKVEYVMDMIR